MTCRTTTSSIAQGSAPEPLGEGRTRNTTVAALYLDPDNDWNALYYGNGANTKSIVIDRRYSNPGAEPIRQYLAKW